jgi:hypothetical protein
MTLSALSALALCPIAVRARTRPRFEPTDLEWEETGVLEFDLEVGAIRTEGPWRLTVADFEMDVGLLPNLELGLDGAIAVEGPAEGPFSFDHTVYDVLWASAKIGLWDDVDEQTQRTRAIGLQLGPKLPVHATQGVGAETLILTGTRARPLTFALNVGGFVDPAPDAMSYRPWGAEAGVDIEIDLGKSDQLTLTGELAGILFGSADANQLHATAGLSWSVSPNLDLSVVGLVGLLPGGDRYGFLVGAEPKLRLFRR